MKGSNYYDMLIYYVVSSIEGAWSWVHHKLSLSLVGCPYFQLFYSHHAEDITLYTNIPTACSTYFAAYKVVWASYSMTDLTYLLNKLYGTVWEVYRMCKVIDDTCYIYINNCYTLFILSSNTGLLHNCLGNPSWRIKRRGKGDWTKVHCGCG